MFKVAFFLGNLFQNSCKMVPWTTENRFRFGHCQYWLNLLFFAEQIEIFGFQDAKLFSNTVFNYGEEFHFKKRCKVYIAVSNQQ